jgi:hypothetical protein
MVLSEGKFVMNSQRFLSWSFSVYRIAIPTQDAALQLLGILTAVDAFMSQERDPRLAWVAISCTLKLTSTNKLTEAEIARQIGVSELSVRRAVGKFTRLADIDSAGGLRALGQIRSNGGPPSKKTVSECRTACPHLICSVSQAQHSKVSR